MCDILFGALYTCLILAPIFGAFLMLEVVFNIVYRKSAKFRKWFRSICSEYDD